MIITLINIFLWVAPVNANSESNKGTLIFLLDNSGSMGEPYNGDTKINSAKDSIRHAITSRKTDSMKMGLIELGGHCEAKELVQPRVNNQEVIIEALKQVNPRPYRDAATPIAEGIAKASIILKENPGPHKIILVSDGEANCAGKNEFPLSGCDMVASLRNQNIKFELNLIGYGLNSLNNEQAKCIAKLSDKVIKPKNISELKKVLSEVIQIKEATNFFKDLGNFFTSIHGFLTALIGLAALFLQFFRPKKTKSFSFLQIKPKSNNSFWR
jgi:von Willebrand factor type A domain